MNSDSYIFIGYLFTSKFHDILLLQCTASEVDDDSGGGGDGGGGACSQQPPRW